MERDKSKNRIVKTFCIEREFITLFEKNVPNYSNFVNDAIREKFERDGFLKNKIVSKEIKL